jgi:hypothetical protein
MTTAWRGTTLQWRLRLAIGLGVGAVIAAVDNILFQGEVSPIVIVGLLLVTSIAAGAWSGWRGWVVAVAAWTCVPAAHVIKKVLALPDTLHPNTYASILKLAVFTFGVTTIGMVMGLTLRRLAMRGPMHPEPGPAADGGA